MWRPGWTHFQSHATAAVAWISRAADCSFNVQQDRNFLTSLSLLSSALTVTVRFWHCISQSSKSKGSHSSHRTDLRKWTRSYLQEKTNLNRSEKITVCEWAKDMKTQLQLWCEHSQRYRLTGDFFNQSKELTNPWSTNGANTEKTKIHSWVQVCVHVRGRTVETCWSLQGCNPRNKLHILHHKCQI